MSEIIWVSDSDVCEMCDGLLDWFGMCPHCGWDGVDDEDDEYPPFEDDYEPPTIGMPEEKQPTITFTDADIDQYIKRWVAQGWLTIL